MKGTCDMSDKCRSDRCFMGAHVFPEVWTLRRFRDIVVKKCRLGRLFAPAYYAISSGIVVRYGHAECLTGFCRRRLDRPVALLQKKGFGNTPYVDGGK